MLRDLRRGCPRHAVRLTPRTQAAEGLATPLAACGHPPFAAGRTKEARAPSTTTSSASTCGTWRGATTRSGSTSTLASAVPHGRWRRARSVRPELGVSANSLPRWRIANTYLHLQRTQVFTKFFPRCGVLPVSRPWGLGVCLSFVSLPPGLIRTHGDLVERASQRFPTVEVRICRRQPGVDWCLVGGPTTASSYYCLRGAALGKGRALPADNSVIEETLLAGEDRAGAWPAS